MSSQGVCYMALSMSLQKCVYCGSESLQGPYCCAACESLANVTKSPKTGPAEEYSYLDQENFRSLYKIDNADYNYLFFAEGIHCSSCVHLLEKLPFYCEGVSMAEVHFGNSTVGIKLEDQSSLGAVATTIKELGYNPIPLTAEENTEEKYKLENRAALKRIAVAGFCAGNMMLFVIPVYAGLSGPLGELFNWISFALFLPILFYSAVPFYKGSLASLKYKSISIDLPIVIALLSSFVFSVVNLIRKDGSIYFDSTASFLFLILSARYLLKRVQQNYLSTSVLKNNFKNERYSRFTRENSVEVVPFSALRVGDTVLIKTNQILPMDSHLVSEQALLDMSLLNGESLPKAFTKGLGLLGGTKVLEKDITVQIASSFEDSKIGQLFKKLETSSRVKNDFINLTDSLAQKLILVVFSLALIFFVIYSTIDVSEAFNRSLALIVLACPCALAFGSPLTYGFALKKALQKGILIKNAAIFESVLKIKNIFFDKTGTLTEGHLRLTHSEPEVISPEVRQVILSLENQSYHPIAFALRKEWGQSTTLLPTENPCEILGYGVQGKIGGHFYELRSLSESTHDSELAIELSKNGTPLCRLYFSDAIREESPAVVHTLQTSGMKCFILSGDTKARTIAAGLACNIGRENTYASLFPEDKKSILEKHPNSCMLGDGANDSLSLQHADVGIAVKGSVDLSLSHSDVYFTRGGLTPLLDLIHIAQKTRIVLVRNLSISLVYNTLGGVLALSGFVSPLLAAILMPISSAVIILSCLWGFR